MRAGQLTPSWSAAFAVGWGLVVLGLLAVWRSSWLLGLSTWWLGSRSSPSWVAPAVIALPGALIGAAWFRVRYLPWAGIGIAALIGAVALGDRAQRPSLAIVEGLLALAGLLISLAALMGMYRPARRRGPAERR